LRKKRPETVITAIKSASDSLIPKENTRNPGLCPAGFNPRECGYRFTEFVAIMRIML